MTAITMIILTGIVIGLVGLLCVVVYKSMQYENDLVEKNTNV